MDARARDRRDIHDGAVGRLQFRDEAAGQHDGCEEIDLEHGLPVRDVHFDGPEPRSARPLGRDTGIVDESVEPARAQPLDRLEHLGSVYLGLVRRSRHVDAAAVHDDLVDDAVDALADDRLGRCPVDLLDARVVVLERGDREATDHCGDQRQQRHHADDSQRDGVLPSQHVAPSSRAIGGRAHRASIGPVDARWPSA